MPHEPFESEDRFREMLAATTACFAAISNDFVFLYANEAYASLWNKRPDDLIGKPVKEIMGAEGFENSLDSFVDAISGETVNYEAEFCVGQRSVVLATRLVPFFESNPDSTGQKKSKGFYCLSNEVTGKRASQQALSLILASAPGRICLVNRDYEITYANRRFQEDYRAEGDLKGVSLADIVGKDLWKSGKPHVDRAFVGNFVRYREKFTNRNGSITNVMVYLIPDRAKNPQDINGVYCLTFDEAELELGRQRLRRRERNVDLALQGQMVGIWEVDPDRDDWLLTEHIEKLLQLPAGHLANSESLTFKNIHPDDLPGVLRNRQLNLRAGTLYVNEFRMKDNSGEYRWLRSIGRSELDANGEVIYLAGTIADINQLKTAEILAAEQVLHRDSFLSMLSHELRNPVSAIKYALDIFQRQADETIKLPEDHQNSIGIIARQTNIISRLLKDLLNVNRISSNEILFEDTQVCLVKLIREIAEVSVPRFAEKRQRLVVHFEVAEFMISGDEVRLHQVFTNLLDNASKYSPANTTTTLTCRVDPKSGDFVTVVSDQGQGIRSESQRSIFEMFFQEDPELDRSTGGLGIGLYLVKRIVEAHYGKVRVVSPGNQGGSDFEVRLPRARPGQKPESNQPTSPTLRQLVLVEDNDDSRVALSLALSARNFEVQTFSDGETAAIKLPLLRPDIALIDIGLPRMDGMSLVKELRQHEDLNDTLFVALTGYGQDHEHQAIMAAGFDHHLVKPLDLDDLFQIVAQHVKS